MLSHKLSGSRGNQQKNRTDKYMKTRNASSMLSCDSDQRGGGGDSEKSIPPCGSDALRPPSHCVPHVSSCSTAARPFRGREPPHAAPSSLCGPEEPITDSVGSERRKETGLLRRWLSGCRILPGGAGFQSSGPFRPGSFSASPFWSDRSLTGSSRRWGPVQRERHRLGPIHC